MKGRALPKELAAKILVDSQGPGGALVCIVRLRERSGILTPFP